MQTPCCQEGVRGFAKGVGTGIAGVSSRFPLFESFRVPTCEAPIFGSLAEWWAVVVHTHSLNPLPDRDPITYLGAQVR